MSKDINLNVAQGVAEVIIREGKAQELREPLKVSLSGNIQAPWDYVKTRLHKYDPEKCVLIVDSTANRILLLINEKDFFKDEIEGKLAPFPELEELKINKEHYHTSSGLLKLLKRYKFWFKDPSKHESFITGLMNFTGKITTNFKRAKDGRGNSINSVERTVTDAQDLPKFILEMPIFKGHKPVAFGVEVNFDPTEDDLMLYLESTDLFMLMRTESKELIEREVRLFEEHGFTVVTVS